MSGTVELDFDGHVATLRLDNESRRNAMSTAMWHQLVERGRAAAELSDVRVVVVRGAGTKAFCAGADIADFDTARTGPDNAPIYDDLVEEACGAIEAIRCPTIAVVYGACMGAGVSIASSCDFRIADTRAEFAVPAARVGLGYDPRGVERLVRVWGGAASNALLLTAARMPAQRAYQLGMVSAVCDQDQMQQAVGDMVARIAANAPITTAAAKAAIRAHTTGVPRLLDHAFELYRAADASKDYQEGRRAFAEKRSPQFTGK